jgi:hypothetical protein
MTIVQQIPAADAAVAAVDRLLGDCSFTVTEVALVGRRGGTVWETLLSFPLQGEAS